MTKKTPVTTPLLSILVPIYNVERYLAQCLTSITSQTLKDIEIICINDGSTDSSLSIIKDFMKRDPRIILINKKNTGYGDSMNQGLKKAKGKYVGIVESDDWVDTDMAEVMCMLAELYDVEVVRANYYHNKNNRDIRFAYLDEQDTGRVIDPRNFTKIFHQSPAIWSAVYRRDFLIKNDIEFLPTPGASYQDTGFNYKVWATAKRAFFTPEAFLHYRLDNESSSVNSPGKVFNVCSEYDEIERYLKERNLWQELAPLVYATKINSYLWNSMRLSRKLLPQFLDRIMPEYHTALEQNQLIREYYLDDTAWHFAELLANGSRGQCIRFAHRHRRRVKIRSLLKSAYIRFNPIYAKQLRLNSTIDQLLAQNSLLEQRIELLLHGKEES